MCLKSCCSHLYLAKVRMALAFVDIVINLAFFIAKTYVLVHCQASCTLTKPVLFETLVIRLFTGAEHAVIYFFCGNLFCASALPSLKPGLIAFILLVWDHSCWDTHRNTHNHKQNVFMLHTFLLTVHSAPDQNESAWIKMRPV